MEIVDQAFDYLRDFASTSENVYHVNPWVFCVLFFGSAIPLYYGYYRIGRSALKLENHKLKRKELDKSELKLGIVISVIAWWLPYLYVIIFGKLPMDMWFLFLTFVLIMGFFFVKTLRIKVKQAGNKSSE